MIESKQWRSKRGVTRWLAGGLALLVSGAAMSHVHGQASHQKCVAQQTNLLVKSTHEMVPDRAGFAAEHWCFRNNNQPGQKRF
jgi:hypothetical protein